MSPSERYIVKIWATKESQKPFTAKRTMGVKHVMYAIFLTNQGPAIPIVAPKGLSVNAKFYKSKVLHELKKHLKNRRPKLVSVVSCCCMIMLRHTQRQLYI
jgi:hypothetical protein